MIHLEKDTRLSSVLSILAGIIVCTISQAFFLVPNKIVPGGLVGVGTIIFHVSGIPIGLFVIACNIFLIFLQSRFIGAGSSRKTIFAILIQGFLLDFLVSVLKVQRLASDPMLACIYGGILTGFGTHLIFRGGGTLGGTDILAQMLAKFKRIPVGTTFFWSDIVVLSLAAAVYGPNLALFALIKSFIVSQTVDNFMEGFSVNRQILIISKNPEMLSWAIMEEMKRGVTLLSGRGAYTGNSTEVLLTAVRRRELPMLEEIIYRLDPDAFIIVTDARRILGKGFDHLEDDLAAKHKLEGTPPPRREPLMPDSREIQE